MSGVQRGYGYQYETVAASQTTQMLGASGAAGDYLHRLIVTVNTAATSTVTLTDGVTAIPIVPALIGAGVGVVDIELNMASLTSGWKVTTGAGVTVVAVGLFS
jgi:uncharacterized spore protein YtfJ|tara:strand:+ start:2204 stop:2512 length:309 start_codon:yes stop_codon:yes gene_type:complete